MQRLADSKGNIIDVTLFESYLSRFVLEHPQFYQAIYIKLLTAIEEFISQNRHDRPAQRFIDGMFYDLHARFKHARSFTDLRNHFNLIATKICIKKCCDYLLEYKEQDLLPIKPAPATLFARSYQALYSNPKQGMNKLYKHLRAKELFRGANRGVKINEKPEPDINILNRNLGIVERTYLPPDLTDYFDAPNNSAGLEYVPDYSGQVANWLQDRHLPVISGSSGSIEQLFSRLLPLVQLSKTEIRMLLLAHSAGMVAMGHHSFFECMLVADRFGFKLKETETLLEFYLQIIPEAVAKHPDFVKFMDSDTGAALINDMSSRRTPGSSRESCSVN